MLHVVNCDAALGKVGRQAGGVGNSRKMHAKLASAKKRLIGSFCLEQGNATVAKQLYGCNRP